VIVFILLFTVFVTCFAGDDGIEFLAEKNIISGDGGGLRLDEYITRAEFIKMTVKSLDKNIGMSGTSFMDIKPDDWFYSYVSFAEKEKIISGYDNRFYPNDFIKREDAAVILSRAYRTDNTLSFNISKFGDGIYISEYALPAMAYMSSEGIITGYEGKIRPCDFLTRREAAYIIYRIMTKVPAQGDSAYADFCGGYPKLRNDGISNGFNISIKTTAPCNVYYTLSKKEYSVFDKIIPDSFLISSYDTNEFNAFIPAEKDQKYNIYFCTVDKDGNRGKVNVIKEVVANPYTAGDGTLRNPYIIKNESQLYSVRYFSGSCFKLGNDIVLSENWQPIGDSQTPFSGVLDGGGFEISALNMERTGNGGLFGIIEGGTVKNLSVYAGKITADEEVGIIAGRLVDGKIENCHTNGIVMARNRSAGGIVGVNAGSILNSQTTSPAVKADTYAGGIAGVNSGRIRGCISAAYLVTANMYASGIAGINEGGSISDCCGVNMNIVDGMVSNSGNITTNRRGGRLENNYSYDLTNSNSKNGEGENSINGKPVSISDLSDRKFYIKNLGWNFDRHWRESNDEFLIPSVKNTDVPKVEKGLSVYAPVPVYTAEDFLSINENPLAHYAVMNDIDLGNTESICQYIDNAFSGSIDGRGHTLSDITIDYSENKLAYGLIGYVSNGIIRNLNIENMFISGGDVTGGVVGVNYGMIDNLNINTLSVKGDQVNGENATIGGIVGINYGTVQRSGIKGSNISARGSNITVGMCTGYNEGSVSVCMAKGRINASGYETSSVTVGGICGFNTALISEVFADVQISAKGKLSYLGGVIGVSDGGEIYAASSMGSINSSYRNSVVYGGGIFALGSNMKLSNCHSHTGVDISSDDLYAGGIGGYSLGSTVQNSYTAAVIKAVSESEGFVGGICGVNEKGFINSSVSLAKVQTAGEYGRIAAVSVEGGLNNNYAVKDEFNLEDSDLNGKGLDEREFWRSGFYFDKIADGGKLGWSYIYSDKNGVWKWGAGINPSFRMPVLANVPGQEYFTVQ